MTSTAAARIPFAFAPLFNGAACPDCSRPDGAGRGLWEEMECSGLVVFSMITCPCGRREVAEAGEVEVIKLSL